MQLKSEKGQAMVEFALVLPLLLLLLCGIIDFSWIYGNQLALNHACRDAARYSAIHYYDSSTDDDEAIAAEIVSSGVPSFTPEVTMTVSASGEVTLHASGKIVILTPILSTLLGDAEFTVSAQSVMRLE